MFDFTQECQAVLVLLYGSILLLTAIFTLSLEMFSLIEEKLTKNIFLTPMLYLDRNIDFFDAWAKKKNRLIGSILTLISLWLVWGFLKFPISCLKI